MNTYKHLIKEGEQLQTMSNEYSMNSAEALKNGNVGYTFDPWFIVDRFEDIIDSNDGVTNGSLAIADWSDCNTVNAIDSTTGLTTVIPIENAGFEIPVLEDGVFTAGFSQGEPIPGWTPYDPNDLITGIPLTLGGVLYTDVGTINPLSAQYPNEPPEGQNVGYSFVVNPFGSGVVGFTQTLDTFLTVNTKYTLQVEVGNPQGVDQFGNDYTGFPGYRVELVAGGNVLAADNNTLNIEEGEFKTSEVSFLAFADNLYLGNNLEIRLINLGQGPGLSIDFDNVSLTTTVLAYQLPAEKNCQPC